MVRDQESMAWVLLAMQSNLVCGFYILPELNLIYPYSCHAIDKVVVAIPSKMQKQGTTGSRKWKCVFMFPLLEAPGAYFLTLVCVQGLKMTSSLSMILLNVSVEIIHKIRRLWFGPHTLDNKLSGVFSLMNRDNTFWVSLFCKPQKEKKKLWRGFENFRRLC